MKKLVSLIFVLLLLMPAQVFAHSKMTVSTPNSNDVLGQSPAIISMEYNTDIASLSTFTLENEQGESIPINDIKVEGHILSGIPAVSLEANSYTVKWTIIGADGHTINGDFEFKVNAPVNTENSTEPSDTEQPVATPTPTPTVTPVPVEDTLEEATKTEDSTNNLYIIFIIAIILAVVAIFIVRGNKKK